MSSCDYFGRLLGLTATERRQRISEALDDHARVEVMVDHRHADGKGTRTSSARRYFGKSGFSGAKPTWDRAARWSGEEPNNFTVPESGRVSPTIVLTTVDLPAPLGPSRPNT